MKRSLDKAFVAVCVLMAALLLSSWEGGSGVGPVPPAPDYADSTQWFVVDRRGEADLFYIISTETGDHMMGDDTCHFADTQDDYLRERMRHEMHAVDSFYSGRLNYFSPYYRQVSMQSWATEEMAMSRLPVALADCRRSWDYYIDHLNQGRPFILAGFSQGAYAMMDIIRRMADSVARRMVAAYAIGYKVTREDTAGCPHIRPARFATDTGVTVCFNSVKSPECEIGVVSGGNLFCINPVNWHTDTVAASFVLYGRRQNDTLSVRLDPKSRLLLVGGYHNDKPMPVIGKPGNYHHMELKFYYPYIRQNMNERVKAFMEKKLE